jgi:PKD repeat protein
MRTTIAVGLTLLVLCVTAMAPASAGVIYSFPCDKTPGVGGEGFTLTGNWQYGAPGGLGGLICVLAIPGDCESYDPASAHTGSYVYGYDIGGDGLYDNDLGPTPLTTTALNCVGYANVTLRFWRWLAVEPPVYDHASIEVSNNGTDWTLVWENPVFIEDLAWTQVEYDISAVADGEPTVYVRWVMGPTDDMARWCGWNIDDIEILGDPVMPTEILAWIPYTDMVPGGEYDNTLAALDTYHPWYNLTTSVTEDAGVLATELAGKDVFLAMEQENATSAQLATLGAAFADVLTDFVEQGGTVIVLGELDIYFEGFLDATGLMSCDAVADYWLGEALPVVSPSHPLAFGLGATVAAQNLTNAYTVGPEATVVIEDGFSNAVEAVRLLGAGAVIVIGYDYYEYDADAARVLANAVQYPQATGDILLYQDSNIQFLAQQALDDLGYSYQTAARDDFDSWLTQKSWGIVVVDSPSWKPTGGFGEFVNFLDAGGRATISTWTLTAEPALTAAFGVSADETFSAVPPIYRWEPSHAVFTSPMDVPDLSTFNDDWLSDADRLSYVSGDVVGLAGYTPAPGPGQAAIVLTDDIRILNAFLWDEANQDDDTDSVDDVLELIINEIEYLRPGPRADFSADDTQAAVDQVITFTDQSAGTPVAWYWDFGDGEYSVEQDPVHAYTGTGAYTVTLTASNADGQDTVPKTDYITVGVTGVAAAFSATPTEGIMGMTVDFTDESTGPVGSWDWDFGDGESATDQSPSHVYADPGIYDVSLTVTDVYGSDIETKIAYVWVGFLDCGPDNWAFQHTMLAVYFGVVTGYPGGYYEPTWAVNRGQMATYIARALAGGDSSVPEATPPATFDDVPEGYWAWKYVEYAVTENVVTGYDPTTYAPEVDVDRGQMAVFIARARGWVSVGDDMTTAPEVFPDVPSGFWAGTAVEACVDNLVVQGYEDGLYHPEVIVTRDQMAVYVARAFGMLP